ncbi:hypothetical protein [Mycobacterium avium]|uniref:hypothetical protein n=1 Tax=Mycobacterium avium TaxID=1764 RepID=UPI000A04A5EE|nr:hypothetical protein [Mycobacterium avium]
MTVVEDYQEQAEALAASTAAQMLALYAALQAGGIAPSTAVEAMAAVVNAANAAATTLADVFVSAQVEAAAGVPSPPTGIAPRDDLERLAKAVETILDDLGAVPRPRQAETPSDLQRATAPSLRDTGQRVGAVARPDEPDPAETAAMRLERLARSEPLETGQSVSVEVINRLPRAVGWTRKLDADPCERCQRWAENGRVFPAGHHFKRHYGCNCAAEIVTREGKSS